MKSTSRLVAILIVALSTAGCMTPSQRYMSWKAEQDKRYGQQRTYQPFVVTSRDGIEFKGETTFTINVPLEQLAVTPIPDDVKTVADFTRWAIGAGLVGYSIHRAAHGGDTTNNTTNNYNAGGAQ